MKGYDGSWRDSARPIIARVLAETRGQDERAIRKALRAAWPFGPYGMYPLKIWRDEIRRQLKPRSNPVVLDMKKPRVPDPAQLPLFV